MPRTAGAWDYPCLAPKGGMVRSSRSRRTPPGQPLTHAGGGLGLGQQLPPLGFGNRRAPRPRHHHGYGEGKHRDIGREAPGKEFGLLGTAHARGILRPGRTAARSRCHSHRSTRATASLPRMPNGTAGRSGPWSNPGRAGREESAVALVSLHPVSRISRSRCPAEHSRCQVGSWSCLPLGKAGGIAPTIPSVLGEQLVGGSLCLQSLSQHWSHTSIPRVCSWPIPRDPGGLLRQRGMNPTSLHSHVWGCLIKGGGLARFCHGRAVTHGRAQGEPALPRYPWGAQHPRWQSHHSRGWGWSPQSRLYELPGRAWSALAVSAWISPRLHFPGGGKRRLPVAVTLVRLPRNIFQPFYVTYSRGVKNPPGRAPRSGMGQRPGNPRRIPGSALSLCNHPFGAGRTPGGDGEAGAGGGSLSLPLFPPFPAPGNLCGC